MCALPTHISTGMAPFLCLLLLLLFSGRIISSVLWTDVLPTDTALSADRSDRGNNTHKRLLIAAHRAKPQFILFAQFIYPYRTNIAPYYPYWTNIAPYYPYWTNIAPYYQYWTMNFPRISLSSVSIYEDFKTAYIVPGPVERAW